MDKSARNTFPIHPLLKKRWSPRAFADKPVSADILRSLFEAARWAPSSYNEQPWRFLVATKDQPADYAKLLECLIEFNQSWAKSAPVLVIGVASLAFERNQQPNRHGYYDLGQAMAQLVVQATELGLYAHQMAGILPDKARSTLGIPAGFDAVVGMALGYLGDPASLPDGLRQKEEVEPARKPLGELVFGGDWGKVASFLPGK